MLYRPIHSLDFFLLQKFRKALSINSHFIALRKSQNTELFEFFSRAFFIVSDWVIFNISYKKCHFSANTASTVVFLMLQLMFLMTNNLAVRSDDVFIYLESSNGFNCSCLERG